MDPKPQNKRAWTWICAKKVSMALESLLKVFVTCGSVAKEKRVEENVQSSFAVPSLRNYVKQATGGPHFTYFLGR